MIIKNLYRYNIVIMKVFIKLILINVYLFD